VVLFLLFVTTNSAFYGVAYLFGLIFIWGLILAVYNLEVLTGFLLVVELTAVLVLILFLLALNFEGRRSSHATPMA
jgi:NADH:ubiquinone oxidoreductase subunit 6 (subunit J)